MRRNRPGIAAAGAALAWLALSVAAVRPGGASVPDAAFAAEQAEVLQWRAARLQWLTGDTGWLSLVGLLWLKDGANTFGRGDGNALVLDNPSLAEEAGTFVVHEHKVQFMARPGAGITHHGAPVSEIELVSDAAGEPTVVSSGPLRFFVIERAGRLGVRVRDLNSPRRIDFKGLEYFPVSTDWRVTARFEPYEPARHIKIINILGMEDDALAPGALVFSKAGHEWRLDAVLENPGDTQLFVMFQDATSGHETYGGGRFMYAPMPVAGSTVLDFNKAYNPPCALNDFATCPLPPPQNRLGMRVDAGELKYRGATAHAP
ncbi:MAG: DUF1684 domain-containing protein [Proteobacteria bacterium]|nr:DUF1684 domain-containing protein [Pseudomonadota bacterium]